MWGGVFSSLYSSPGQPRRCVCVCVGGESLAACINLQVSHAGVCVCVSGGWGGGSSLY